MAMILTSLGRTVAAGSVHGLVQFWDTRTGAQRFPGHEQGITGLALSPDGLTVTSAARGFWREPGDVERMRSAPLASGLFNWP